jgi:hypothetical protein
MTDTGDETEKPTPAGAITLDRRALLKLGAAGTLSTLLYAAGADVPAFGGLLKTGNTASAALLQPASLGYWTAAGADSGAGFKADMIAAKSLAAGDMSLVDSGVYLRVVGFGAGNDPSACAALASAAIEVDYRPFAEARYLAWAVENSHCVSTSASLGFTVPVAAKSGLSLSILHRGAGEDTEQEQTFKLSTGNRTNQLKLVSGTYIIAFRHPTTGKLPNWPAFQLRAADPENVGDKRQLYRFNRTQQRLIAADFPYIILSIAPA